MTSTLARPEPSPAPDPGAAPERRHGPADRFRGSWRVALRHGARDARRHKGRTALVAAMVMLPVAVGTFATTSLLAMTTEQPATRAARELGPDLQAKVEYFGTPLQQSPNADGILVGETREGPVPLIDLEARLSATLRDDQTAVRALVLSAQLHANGLQRDTGAIQVDLDLPAVAAAFALAEGELPRSGEVALDPEQAAELGVGVGDVVTLASSRLTAQDSPGEVSLTVSGLLDPDTSMHWAVLPGTGPVPTPETIGQSPANPSVFWWVAGETGVTWDDVIALNDASFQAISRDVLLDPPPRDAVPFYRETASAALADSAEAWGPFGAVVVVALLEAVLLIGPVFAVGTRRSARSLAVVAANGGTVRTLRAIVMGAGVVIGTLASLAGVALGVAGSVVLWSVFVRRPSFPPVPWLPVVGIAVVGMLLAVAASWLPARRASRADVVAVLAGRRGEASHRRWPAVVGAAVGIAGFTGAVAGGLAGQALLVAAGVVVGEIGLVIACGGIVALIGRLAKRLPLSWRFALRDATRNRSRTAPAIAAVLVASAGMAGALVYTYSHALYEYRIQSLWARPGTLAIAPDAFPIDPDQPRTFDDDDVERITALVAEVIPDVELIPVSVPHAMATESSRTVVNPVFVDRGLRGFGAGAGGPGAIAGPVIDDGSLVDLFDIPEPDAARAALSAGRVVASPWHVTPEGTIDLSVGTFNLRTQEEIGDDRLVEVPATAVGELAGPERLALPLIPPEVAEARNLPLSTGGLVAAPTTPPTQAQLQTLQARVTEAYGESDQGTCVVCVGLAEPPQDDGVPSLGRSLLILGGTGALALAAAWIAAALAATESRPDLATLAAVGAPPATRKRIIAAQTGTIVVIGAVLGVVSGTAIGAAFVYYSRFQWLEDPRWSLVIPWPLLVAAVVALPLVAVTASWLATRSRLVLTRRVAA